MSKDLITLVCPPTEFEANILAIVLRDNGIEAFVFATPTIGVGVGLSAGRLGVPLQVMREDVEIARRVLLENKHNSIDIDWDELGLGDDDNSEYEPLETHPITARISFFCVVLALISGLIYMILQLLN
ncbi:MAG: hypothetical protein QF718_01250 [Phycisphaerales bacterium]|jgi:hypothetical protein|nr:hypothetical protein [Phycisphaerales bacterium]